MTAQLSKKSEAWSARFNEPVSDLVKRYTASVFFDKRLAQVDIQGSLAHAEMLAHQNIISQHQGLIECESHPGHTTFSIFLPLEQGAPTT